MALRRFELPPLAAALYVSPYTPDDFAQLRDRCATDLPGVAAELTVLLVTVFQDCPAVASKPTTVTTNGTADPRLDSAITTAATVISAISRANRAADRTASVQDEQVS